MIHLNHFSYAASEGDEGEKRLRVLGATTASERAALRPEGEAPPCDQKQLTWGPV